MKKVLLLTFLALSLCFHFSISAIAESISAPVLDDVVVIADDLKSKLRTLGDNDTVKIAVWIDDIDHNAIETEILRNTKTAENYLSEETNKSTVNSYKKAKLDSTVKSYKTKNNSFLNSSLKNNKDIVILYQSNISPMFILEVNKNTVYELNKNPLVCRINLHEELIEESFSNIANENSGVNYLATSSYTSATGDGVKIGMLEYGGVPNEDFVCGTTPLFNKAKLHEVDSGATTVVNTHATLVAAIMVGQSVVYNGITYKGIAPEAELYYTAYTNSTNFYAATEALVLAGVDIINMSAGGYMKYATHASYNNRCEWVDFLVRIENIHFVAAAGNATSDNPNKCIYFPSMAFNAITVGAYNDNNQILPRHAPETLSSQEINSRFNICSFSCYQSGIGSKAINKPEIIASGENIAYANVSNPGGNSGTSYCAPQVAGMIAQLCDLYPALKTKPFLVKSMLMSSAAYRLDPNLSVNEDTKDDYSEMFNKQGAGIANVRCAYTNYYAGRYREFNLSTSHSFTINVPSSYSYIRMAMCWDKNIYLGEGPQYEDSSNDGIYELPHKNFKLEVYDTSSTLVASSNTPYSTCELLQFNITQGGAYTVVITDLSPEVRAQHKVAISWY